jgi:hypothetical protein
VKDHYGLGFDITTESNPVNLIHISPLNPLLNEAIGNNPRFARRAAAAVRAGRWLMVGHGVTSSRTGAVNKRALKREGK